MISIGLISVFAAYFILRSGQREVQHTLEDQAFLLSDALASPFSDIIDSQTSTKPLKDIIDQFIKKYPDLNYSVFNPTGQIILTNEGIPIQETTYLIFPEVTQAFQGTRGYVIRPSANGITTCYIAVPISGDNNVNGVLRLSTPMYPGMVPTYQSLTLLAILSLVLLIAVALLGWRQSISLARPIHDLTETSIRLSRGELSARATPSGPHELHQLADTFNHMAARLQANLAGLQAFVANASHELRTPLTAVKLNVEALREGALDEPQVAQRFLKQIEDELDRLNRMVNDLLVLSRIEANRDNVLYEEMDVSQIAKETRAFWQARALKARINLVLSSRNEQLPRVRVNEDQFRQLLDNLLDNSIKNTPPGGCVEITLSNNLNRSAVRLEIIDNGHGVSEEHLPHVFERFYHIDDAQNSTNNYSSGSGLGLAIVKSIVEAHGGELGIISEPGKGTTIWVDIPAFE
ncbi:MAG: HAMP domain-containing sensor histidine kinase [Anaerolineaceae bacterium]|nr:HAMP domain-containing sensor histidine kinase [Anaerolineaceae bacterium]